jgi:hypothetical protein
LLPSQHIHLEAEAKRLTLWTEIVLNEAKAAVSAEVREIAYEDDRTDLDEMTNIVNE